MAKKTQRKKSTGRRTRGAGRKKATIKKAPARKTTAQKKPARKKPAPRKKAPAPSAPRRAAPREQRIQMLIAGRFVESESGRQTPVGAPDGTIVHTPRASRRDLESAIEAAFEARGAWSGTDPLERARLLARAATSVAQSTDGGAHDEEGRLASDRLLHYAGWCDKIGALFGGRDAIAGPFCATSDAEPVGVVGTIGPDEPGLLGLVSLVSPALAAGNCVVALASETDPGACEPLARALNGAGLPDGAFNLLTGFREELLHNLCVSDTIDTVSAAGLSAEELSLVRSASGDGLKRVSVRRPTPRQWRDDTSTQGPMWIEPVVELKTVWHPSAL